MTFHIVLPCFDRKHLQHNEPFTMNNIVFDSSIELATDDCCPICDSADLDRVPKKGLEKAINLIWPHRVFHCYDCNNRIKLFEGSFANVRFLLLLSIVLVVGSILFVGTRAMLESLLASRESYKPYTVEENDETFVKSSRNPTRVDLLTSTLNTKTDLGVMANSSELQAQLESGSESESESLLNGLSMKEDDYQYVVQQLRDKIATQKSLIARSSQRIDDRDYRHYETFRFSILSSPFSLPEKNQFLKTNPLFKEIVWNDSDHRQYETFRISISSNRDLLANEGRGLNKLTRSEKFAQDERDFNASGK
jgi:hypothetical protein